MSERAAATPWWRTAAIVCALVGAVLPVAARLAAGPQGADINVAWNPSVDEATREQVRARYRLENPRKLPDTYTWRYDLVDTTRSNIRALVQDAAIADTHEIDRDAFLPSPTAPRTPRRLRLGGWGDTVVGFADAVAIELLALAGLALLCGTTIPQFLQRGIPVIDARAAGLFRIVFGSLVLIFFMTHRVDASWLGATFDLEVEGWLHETVLDWLEARPWVVDLITPWLLITGIAFVSGLFTRLSYGLFVAGVLLWAFVAITLESTHPLSALVVALVALLPSRWGDAMSLDAWRRERRGDERAEGTSRQYGYSVWTPGLVLGVAFAAAAWAKLSVPPGWTDWVLNGTIKYHLVNDAGNAPVDWGLQFAAHPRLAILASLGVIVIEAGLVTAAFVRNEWYRLALGLGTAAVFSGFVLFMGVFWPGWWILFLGFLPWQRIGAALSAGAAPFRPSAQTGTHMMATPMQVALVCGVLAQQLVSSSLKLERAPMFSWYDMYSATYESPEVWNASRSPTYRLIVATDAGPLELRACDPYGEFVRDFERALEGEAASRARVWQALSGCGQDLSRARGVTLEGDLRTFDWNQGTFAVSRAAVTLGPLPREVSP
jgi:hypothetical protein